MKFLMMKQFGSFYIGCIQYNTFCSKTSILHQCVDAANGEKSTHHTNGWVPSSANLKKIVCKEQYQPYIINETL